MDAGARLRFSFVFGPGRNPSPGNWVAHILKTHTDTPRCVSKVTLIPLIVDIENWLPQSLRPWRKRKRKVCFHSSSLVPNPASCLGGQKSPFSFPLSILTSFCSYREVFPSHCPLTKAPCPTYHSALRTLWDVSFCLFAYFSFFRAYKMVMQTEKPSLK